MSLSAATYAYGAPPSTSPRPRHLPLDDIARLAERRASKINTNLSTDELVHRLVTRFAETFGRIGGGPVDIDGWVRRTLQEIVAEHRPAVPTKRASDSVETILRRLAAPVRSPALAKQRKLLLRRLSELVPGVECRVLLAMINEPSLDQVSGRLGITPIDVARLHRLALQQLGDAIDRDPELAEQLRLACRQPQRARTSR